MKIIKVMNCISNWQNVRNSLSIKLRIKSYQGIKMNWIPKVQNGCYLLKTKGNRIAKFSETRASLRQNVAVAAG